MFDYKDKDVVLSLKMYANISHPVLVKEKLS